MAISVRNPNHIVAFETESAVQDGDLVVQGSADLKIALPGGASPTTAILGVVYKPGTTSTAAVGSMVDVVLSGIYPVRASGTVTRGNLLTSGGTNGTAIAESAGAGVNVGVIGQALASGVSGDRIPCRIAAFVKQGA